MPKKTEKMIGSKVQVFKGSCTHTSGGLTKADLMKNTRGKVVSKKKHLAGLRNAKNLDGYLQSKGRPTRSARPKKYAELEFIEGPVSKRIRGKGQGGSGIFSDIGSVVDGVGHLFGLGLPAKRGGRKRVVPPRKLGGSVEAYSSDGGKVRRRRVRRRSM